MNGYLKVLGAILGSVGAILGSIAFAWRVFDEFGSFLRISLKVEAPKDGWTTALTTIDNKGRLKKKISYAILLIGPESESPMQTAQMLARQEGYSGLLENTNDLEGFIVTNPVTSEDRMLIPLLFYYSENVRIADETLTYRVPINIEAFAPASPYAVRFYVFPARGERRPKPHIEGLERVWTAKAKSWFPAPWLHRLTQDTFIIEKPKPATSLSEGPP